MVFNVHYTVTAIIIVFYMFLAGKLDFNSKDELVRRITWICTLSVICCAFEILMGLGSNGIFKTDDRNLVYYRNFFFLLTQICCYLQIRIVCVRGKIENIALRFINFVLIPIAFVALTINIGKEYLFTFKNGVFIPYDSFNLLYLIYLVYYIEILVAIIMSRKVLRKHAFILSFSIIVIPIACAAVEINNPNILLSGFDVNLAFLIYSFTLGDDDFESAQAALDELESTKEAIKDSLASAEKNNLVKKKFIERLSQEFVKPIPRLKESTETMLRSSKDVKIIEYAHHMNEAITNLEAFVGEFTRAAHEDNK